MAFGVSIPDLSHPLGAALALAALALAAFPEPAAARRPRPAYEPADPVAVLASPNLFLNAKVTASGQWLDRAPAFAVDGRHDDPNAHWAAENLPVALTVDMGSEREVNAIRLWTYWADGRTYQYLVEGSRDGNSWETLADRRENTLPSSPEGVEMTFPVRAVRYVRATVVGSTAGAERGGHIVEIEGYRLADDQLAARAARERAWTDELPGLNGMVGTLDVRYPRDEVPSAAGADPFPHAAWRGERVNAQVVLSARDGARQVRLEASPLRHASGNRSIPVRARFVRYVLADTVLMPDILDTVERIDVPARTARPVWLSVDVPPNASPGVYSGVVTARAEGGQTVTFPLRLEVLPLRLPAPKDWAFHLDLWQNPYAVARYHQVPLWSDEHFALMRPHLKMLADAGQKCLSTTIIHDPWGGQTYDAYGSMVEWVRTKDGGWRYDYSVFDRYVEFGRSCGLDDYINCYSMVPWTNRLRYLDEATGEYRFASIDPKGEDYARIWAPFLRDFSAHLKRKGWLDRTVIAMDERPLELMRPAIAVLREHGPGLRLALAGDNDLRVEKDIDDWCVIINSAVSDATIRERAARGALTTFYVCTGPERPNTFTYSPPAEAAWMGLYAAARNLNGFLRWAYDSWVEDPLTDTKHVTWQAGDCFLVYPNARSSIRFERLREGIQAYEKIRLLRQQTDPTAPAKREELERALAELTFEHANARPAAGDVHRALGALDQLSRVAARRSSAD